MTIIQTETMPDTERLADDEQPTVTAPARTEPAIPPAPAESAPAAEKAATGQTAQDTVSPQEPPTPPPTAPPVAPPTPAAPNAAAPPSGMPGKAQFAVAIAGAFLALLDTTVVNVSLDATSARFGNIGQVQWVITSYLLALAAVMPATGWLATRFDVKRVFAVAVGLFALGSAACAASQTLVELIAARSVCGAAAGVMTPVATVLLTRGVPRERLGKVQSLSGSVQLIGPLLGPAVGGLLVQTWNWPAVYVMNLPYCAVLLAFTLWKVPSLPAAGHAAKPLELAGLISAALCTVSMVLAIRGFTTHGLHASLTTFGPLAIALASGTVFVLRGLRHRFPLLDLRLFAIRVYRNAAINIFCLGFVLYAPLVLVPLYFQSARGNGATETGLLVSTGGVGVVLAGFGCRVLMRRVGGGVTLFIGILLTIVSTVPMTRLSATTSYPLLCLSLAVRGLGSGLTIVPAMTRAFESIPPRSIPDASSQLNLIQRIGGAVATAVVTVILTRQAIAHRGLTPPAFAHSFDWVLGAYVLALIPALALVLADRHEARRRTGKP